VCGKLGDDARRIVQCKIRSGDTPGRSGIFLDGIAAQIQWQWMAGMRNELVVLEESNGFDNLIRF